MGIGAAAAAIGAVGAIGGGLIAAGGAKSAAKQQDKATKAVIKEERRQYDTNRADLAPWRDTGGLAMLNAVQFTNNRDTTTRRIMNDIRPLKQLDNRNLLATIEVRSTRLES